MGSITFSNASRSITLNHIIDYRISKSTKKATHKIVGKKESWVDHDSITTTPKTLVIRARVTNSEKQTLDLMESDRQVIDITDEHGNTYDNYSMQSLKFSYRMGSSSLPWTVDMQFLASSD